MDMELCRSMKEGESKRMWFVWGVVWWYMVGGIVLTTVEVGMSFSDSLSESSVKSIKLALFSTGSVGAGEGESESLLVFSSGDLLSEEGDRSRTIGSLEGVNASGVGNKVVIFFPFSPFSEMLYQLPS